MSWLLSPAAGTINLGSLQDVTITSPGNGQVLTYQGGTWVNQAVVLLSAIVSVTDDRTLVLADAGKTISRTGSTAGVELTIPAQSSVNYSIGTLIGFNNDGTDAITVAITTDTLIWADDNTTGTRTMAKGGYAVAHKVASATWKIAGKQLT